MIVKDLTTDKYHLFVHQFKNIGKDLNWIRVNTDDKFKIHTGMSVLKKQVNLIPKLKKIYGEDSEFILDMPESTRMTEISEVYRIADKDYDQWFKEFALSRGRKHIKIYDTCYNSNKDEYVVSIIYIGRK